MSVSMQALGLHPSARRPEITFESITFSDGTTVEVEPHDVVVLVGPNNAGKSVALRELEGYVGGNPDSKVVASVELRKVRTSEIFEEFVRKNALVVRWTPSVGQGRGGIKRESRCPWQ